VQEIVLLRALAPSIAPAKRAGYDRLVAAWQARRGREFDEAMAALAAPIAAAACDRATLAAPSLKERLRDAVRSVVAASPESAERQQAARELALRLDAGVRESTARLIAIHGLEGRAADEVRERLVDRVRTDAPMHEGKAAMMGGVLSGALTGLAADLAAGGLTFGAGTLFGALAGAAGGAGIARGFNVLRGRSDTRLRWDDELLDGLVASALLRYLAVAHFGRGRGEWKETEYPAFWRQLVQEALDGRRAALASLWARRGAAASGATLEADLCALLGEAARAVLDTLYPGALAAPGAAGRSPA
jgi:hypothetical protein